MFGFPGIFRLKIVWGLSFVGEMMGDRLSGAIMVSDGCDSAQNAVNKWASEYRLGAID